MSDSIIPYSLKDAPSLIELLLPVQKLSAESYKEQMAGNGKTLTALGSYWKGRKALILNKACILGCLLPATGDSARDLEIFEKLMAMDDESFVARWKRRPKPKDILATLSLARIRDYFTIAPEGILPDSSPVDWSNSDYDDLKIAWRKDLSEIDRRRLEAQMLPKASYRELVEQSARPEEVMDTVHNHIWEAVNAHLGTSSKSFSDLIEQLGIMRFGHRPLIADTFCGSGQIPFEAARLGCDVFASDLSPVACMLTWGAFNIVGGSDESREKLKKDQEDLLRRVQADIDKLGIESDGNGWRAKVFLYCAEVRCPETGWMVPLLPSMIVSKGHRTIIELVPDASRKRYDIVIRSGVSESLFASTQGSLRTDGRGQDPYLIHSVNGKEYRTKISTLRGDYRKEDGTSGNCLRLWEKHDFKPRSDDIFQERLYCIQWMRPKKKGKGDDYEFRTVTAEDLKREQIVETFIAEYLSDWQVKGWIPDMRIEPGYNTDQPIRERGWTHWHHLFNARDLLFFGLFNSASRDGADAIALARCLDRGSKLTRWGTSTNRDNPANVFSNQALNTLYSWCHFSTIEYGRLCELLWRGGGAHIKTKTQVECRSATEHSVRADCFITDPPYGDAVNYHEILEFFIAWLRKNVSPDFSHWVWDSRRSLAIQGADEGFRRCMVAAYKRMTECMPDNGIQVIMFTHQSSAIWADMANIVWASGLHVTAAWYVATERDSPLREGSYVKGTVLLVLRKRSGVHKTSRDELAWEIMEEVEEQVQSLAGLNQQAKNLYRDQNVFEDADIQMAGYAAALRVLTRYAVIDGRDMTVEAIRPRLRGETTFVDDLIAFAVNTANQCLVPQGISKISWEKLSGADRFYLKMLDLETRGVKALDNYQNFAKAFKVRDFRALMGDQRANHARLKTAAEFGRSEMSDGSEMHQSVLRAVLYAVMELVKNLDGTEVLAHLTLNIANYYSDMTQRALAVEMADYLSKRLEGLRPDEASAARVLCELIKSHRLG